MEKTLLEALFGFHFAFAQNPFDASFRPRYGRSFRGIPVLVMPEASQPQSLKPKMVSIPVHFVGLERGRSDSAIKIQKGASE
ncbi:hypothetical protein ES319_D02G217100v1 [Gossypium barbadense]|uniref:Uncharacterized protein n=1 Tax=Gossypium barbadense TaxID=3634 RepID=A0A5J5SG92_GOSBA|nr:hypothetical protein ES319_D02G217100v1 [Gossypium barbadense]PPD76833.1 hypothetical protein GOBAR_DD26234 [Gossypium barbadense]